MKIEIKFWTVSTLIVMVTSCSFAQRDRIYMRAFEENGRWGYEIISNNKCYIHQDYIPAIKGNVPFASKKDAELVGKLILKKIINKESPTVSTGELRQLGIKGTS